MVLGRSASSQRLGGRNRLQPCCCRGLNKSRFPGRLPQLPGVAEEAAGPRLCIDQGRWHRALSPSEKLKPMRRTKPVDLCKSDCT